MRVMLYNILFILILKLQVCRFTHSPQNAHTHFLFYFIFILCGFCRRFSIQDAGVESAWVDYTSEGDSAGASICWTREDEKEYCVAASNNVCCVI